MTPAPPGAPADGPPDPRLARLLRWYPRAPLTWLGMVAVMASAYFFWFFQNLTWVPLSAEAHREARGAVTADAIDGLCVVMGVAVTVGALAAGPALARFLRAGGWPVIRRQVAWAAGATAVAAAALTQFLLLARSMTLDHVPALVVFLPWFIAALVPLGAALWFWSQAAMTMAGRLELQPGVRAVQIMLNAVATIAATAIPSLVMIWVGQTRPSVWLMIGASVLYFYAGCRSAPARLWWAWHRAQQLRAAAGGRPAG